MSVFFFITTVVFFVLFLVAGYDNKNQKKEIERLRKELQKKESTSDQTTEPQSTVGTVKDNNLTPKNVQPQTNNSPYDMSYKHINSAVKSVPFTAESEVLSESVSENAQNTETTDSINNTKQISSEEQHEANAPIQAPEKHHVSSINVLLVIGSLFVILAGFIFATTTWATLGNVVKAVIILSFSAVLFAVSSVAERKFELPKTGKVFYALGCGFLPITVFAVAFFKIFGEWFSFEGNGSGAVIAAAAFLTAAVCFKGSLDYKSRNFAFAFLASFSAIVASLSYQIFKSPDMIMLAYAIYVLIVIFVSRLIQRKCVKRESFAPIVDILPNYELFNTAMMSLSALIVPAAWLEHSMIVTVSCGLFAAAYLFSGFSKKNGFAGAIPFLIFISIASFYGISPESFSEGTYVVAVIATVVTVLSLLKVLPEKLAYSVKLLSNICIAISAAALGIAAISSEITLATVVVMFLLTAEILVLGIFRRNEGAGRLLFALFSYALSASVLTTLKFAALPNYAFAAVSSGILLAISIGYIAADVVLSKKGSSFILRSTVSDVMFSAFTLAVFISEISSGELSLPVILCTAATLFVFALFPKSDWQRFVFAFAAISSLGMVPSVKLLSDLMSDTALFTTVSAVIAAITLVLMLIKKDKLTDNGAFAGFATVNLIYVFISSFKLFSTPDPIWQFLLILAVVCAVKGCVSRHKVPISAAIVLFCMTFASAAYDIFGLDGAAQYVAAGGFAAVLFAALLFVPENSLVEYCKKFTFVCLDIISFVLLCIIASTGTVSIGVNIGAAVITAMTVISGYMTVSSAFLAPTLAAVYLAVGKQLEVAFENSAHVDILIGSAIAVIMALSIGASFLLHRNKVFEKNCKAISFDSFAVSRLIGIAAYYSCIYGEKEEWFGLWLICAAVLSFLRKGNSAAANRSLVSAAMLVPVLAWWTQPFFDLPEGFALEINIVPILLYLAALRLLKWNKAHINDLTFITYIIVYVILFFHALNGTIGNALIVMISAFIVLTVSFFVKMKRWFVLGATVITASAIFMSIKLWGSPAWWVYLLAAGIILIAVGALNEQKKKSAENGTESKLSRFMSEWTW